MNNKLISIVRKNSRVLHPISTELDKKTTPQKTIKSIIFDIYGTIIISASGDIGIRSGLSKSDIFITSLKKANIKINNILAGEKGLNYFYMEIKKSHHKSYEKGIPFPEVIITEIWEKTLLKLIKDNLISTAITADTVLKTATYFECYTNPVWPMPGLLKLLNILNEQNIILGIISNAQFYTPFLFKALTDHSLEELGFDRELIQYSYIQKEAKPSLKMFNKIKFKLDSSYNISPDNTLYVGNDMLNDIYSANKAGFKTALFAGDARSLRLREGDNRVSKVKYDFLITELMQIPELIK